MLCLFLEASDLPETSEIQGTPGVFPSEMFVSVRHISRYHLAAFDSV